MTAEPPSITFTCILGADVSAIPIAFDQRAVFGRARPPVVVELNGHAYRSTIAIMSGVTFVPLRRSNREAAGVAVGETVEVTLTLDTSPRSVTVPDDLAAAIAAAGLDDRWAAKSYSFQREQVEAVEGAKRPETRARRLAAALAALGAKLAEP